MFCYCPQCGLVQKKKVKQNCPVCDSGMEDVPLKYLSTDRNFFQSQEARTAFVNDVISVGKFYNPELAQNREKILADKESSRNQEVSQKVEQYWETKPIHKCPVCGSTSLTTISNAGKVAKVVLIGVWGAGDLGKKWRCNSCGYKF